jgi:hypothetical protein
MINEFENVIRYGYEYMSNFVLKCQVLDLIQRIIFCEIYRIFTYTRILRITR